MKYSLIFCLVLFSINNFLHLISEKIVIIVFILFLYFLMQVIANSINLEFNKKTNQILNDLNFYMNSLFNFLYINKLIYINVKNKINTFFNFSKYFLTKNFIINKLFLKSKWL